MRALAKLAPEEGLTLAERPVPEPGPGEILVRVEAASICGTDLHVWRWDAWARGRIRPPLITGHEFSGVVEAVGPGVTAFAPGDEVVVNPGLSCGHCERCLAGEDNLCPRYEILGEHRHGAYAEYLVVPEVNLLKKPQNLSFEEAAAIPLTFLTAWQMVVDKLQVRPGDDVLVMAAGSGVSVAAIQIAKLFGGRVIATAGSEEKLRKALELGADEAVNYTHPDWFKEVRRLTGGKGADKVVDHTGALYFEGVIKATASGGRIAIAGASSGYEGTLPFAHVFFRQLAILGSTMASKSRLFPILRMVEAGKLKPVLGQVLPLEAASEGHRLLEERRVFGKVVLRVD